MSPGNKYQDSVIEKDEDLWGNRRWTKKPSVKGDIVSDTPIKETGSWKEFSAICHTQKKLKVKEPGFDWNFFWFTWVDQKELFWKNLNWENVSIRLPVGDSESIFFINGWERRTQPTVWGATPLEYCPEYYRKVGHGEQVSRQCSFTAFTLALALILPWEF